MDKLKDALLSQDIIAWIILVVVLVLFLKLLKNAGKGVIILVSILILFAILAQFFPQVLAPMVDFVRGGWLGDNRPDQPW